MGKFAEAEARLFKGRFVCRRCKTVTRASQMKVIQGKVNCKKCQAKALRVKRKK